MSTLRYADAMRRSQRAAFPTTETTNSSRSERDVGVLAEGRFALRR
jgi:hypothetical protein